MFLCPETLVLQDAETQAAPGSPRAEVSKLQHVTPDSRCALAYMPVGSSGWQSQMLPEYDIS